MVRGAGPAPSAAADRSTLILAINDVYRIEGLEGGNAGGLARVRALRTELEREAPDLLLLHGGDFLFPSLASRLFKGEQMVSVLNAMDGDAHKFDSRMFVTFGNHEFDQTRLQDAALLSGRIEGSQFLWLGGNIHFGRNPDGSPLVVSKNLSRTALVESGGIKIGLFGLTIPVLGARYIEDFAGPQATARELSADLRAQGAEVVVALTHLEAATDRALLERLGEAGPDLVIGGHDHESMQMEVAGRYVLKADADARSATVVRLTKKSDGTLQVRPQLRKLSGRSPAPDPQVQTLVEEWNDYHARTFCDATQAPANCLDEAYGHTRTVLEAEENKIRSRETSLGDWIADRMLEAFKPCGAQVAFVNAGALRINSDLPAGTILNRRHIEELFAYPTPLYLLKLDGALLKQVAEQSVRAWPGSGSWLQIAGFGFRHDTRGRLATSLTWLGPPRPRPVAPSDPVLAVTADYLINAEMGDQDGYQMLGRGQVVNDCPVNGTDLKPLIVRDLRAAEPDGIAPAVVGRVCQGEKGSPCLIP